MRIGMLTGGGDCPGLNAVIRAAVRKGIQHYGDEFVGFIGGWRGVLDDTTMPLDLQTTSGILHRGGTILRSSRTNVKKIEGGFERCIEVIQKNKLDALIAMGGDDTQSISVALAERGVSCIGVPKTIDNDLSGTDVCFGFDTAVTIATEAVDRLHSTTEAHSRVQVVEVMGRDAGWIAITVGIAGGADVVLTPERPIDLDQVVKLLKARWDSGKKFAIVVVAEGAQLPHIEGQVSAGTKVDSFGHVRLSGIGQLLAEEIETRTGYETRSVNLGHTQRGGTPTAYDRMLASRYGVAAIDLAHAGKFGELVVLKGTAITSIPIRDAIAKTRIVGDDLFAVLESLQTEAVSGDLGAPRRLLMEHRLKPSQYAVLAAIILTAPVGDSLLAKGMLQVGPVDLQHLSLLWHALFNPYVDLGIVLLIGFFASYTAALSWADLTFVQPATAGSYVVIALLGRFLMHEHLSPARWSGVALIMCAVGFVAGGPSRTEHPKLDHMDAGAEL